MNASSDAAEQVMRMSLEGTEVLIKLSGKGALEAAKLIAGVIKQQNQTRGRARLTNLLKSQKPLTVYSFPKENLAQFKKCAKDYGILYTVLKDKSNRDGMFDVMIPKSDEAKLNRIIERFKFTTFNLADVKTSMKLEKETKNQSGDERKSYSGSKSATKDDGMQDPAKARPTVEQNRSDFEIMMGEKPATENPTMARQEAQKPYRETSKEEDGKVFKAEGQPITVKSSTMSSRTKTDTKEKESVPSDASTSQKKSGDYKTPDGRIDVSDVIRKKREAKAVRDKQKQTQKTLDGKLPKKKPTER